MAYNSNGQVSQTIDADGQTIYFTYNSDEQLTQEVWKNSSGTAVNTLVYSYDAQGNELTAGAASGTYTFTYNADNEVTSVKDMFGVTLTFGYDSDGNQISVQDSFGGITTSVYNADNELQTRELTADGTTTRVDFTYNSRSEVATETASSNLAGTTVIAQATYVYDSDGNLKNLEQTGNSTLFANYTYTYNTADMVTAETLNSTTTSYGYDADNELTSAGTYTYSYDLDGNRNSTGYVIGTGNEMTNDGTWTYTYDNNGNVIEQSKGPSGTTWYYTYNDINQMVGSKEESSPGGAVLQQGTYVYDAFGNLFEEDVNNGTTTTVSRYVRDGWNPDKPSPVGDENYDIYATLNGSNALQTTYMNGDGTAQPLSRISSAGTAAWYWGDRQGTINFLTDNTGTVQDQRTYDAFGDLLTETTPSFGDQFGYAGIFTDKLTSDEISGARNYNPADGRFNETDPAFATPDNLYGYTDDDPTNATDPSGCADVDIAKLDRLKSQIGAPEVNGIMQAQKTENLEIKFDKSADIQLKVRLAVTDESKKEGTFTLIAPVYLHFVRSTTSTSDRNKNLTVQGPAWDIGDGPKTADFKRDFQKNIQGIFNTGAFLLKVKDGTYDKWTFSPKLEIAYSATRGENVFCVEVSSQKIGSSAWCGGITSGVDSWIDYRDANTTGKYTPAAHEFGHLLGLRDRYPEENKFLMSCDTNTLESHYFSRWRQDLADQLALCRLGGKVSIEAK
jgi:RHS repeat-associated protein